MATKKHCIIITRPQGDAERTAELFARQGLESFIQPAFSIETISEAKEEFISLSVGADAVIITSSNAIRALKSFDGFGEIQLIALGEATSIFAKEQGFNAVEYAGENIESLCEYLKLNYAGQKLVYASGTNITKELSFENCGASINRINVYKAISIKKLSEIFKEKLVAGEFCGVSFFSSRTAQTFTEVLIKEGLESHIKSLIAFCFSSKIAEVVKNYGFKATMSPKNANLSAFLKLLSNFNLHK